MILQNPIWRRSVTWYTEGMHAPEGNPRDLQIGALLAKLAAMRDRHKRMQAELEELDDLVRLQDRYGRG